MKTIFFVHWASFDRKWSFLLTEPQYENWLVSRWLKKTKKNLKSFLKKELSNRIRFFYCELPPELVSFIAFSLLGTHNWFILWHEMQTLKTIFIDSILIWRKVTLKVNKTMPNIPSSHKTSMLHNSRKTKFKKTFLILNSTLEQLFNDTTHISLRWIYRLATIDWTKKTHLSI